MQRLKHMLMFAKVVECASFTSAARQLGISVSAISQTISKLEQELEIKLLNRSTRNIGLTEAGKIYYQGCSNMLREVREVHEQLYAFNNTPVGILRIGSSCAMAQNVLAQMTAQMLHEYPALRIDLVTGTPVPDVITHSLDMVIRSGILQDSSLFSRRLGSMSMVICAASQYLTQQGIPQHPDELPRHCWLEYNVPGETQFELIPASGEHLQLIPQGRFITNDTMTLIRWLLAGMGIACVPYIWVAEQIKQGVLKILFPGYRIKPRPVYALYTKKSQLPLKVQVCINCLLAHFATPGYLQEPVS